MQVGSYTDKGLVRNENQDYIKFITSQVGVVDNLFIVCDGIGGNNSGDIASKFTAESIVNELSEYPGDDIFIENILYSVLKKVDKDLTVLANSKPNYSGMGTTVVLATIKEDQLYIANIGDSRLYIYMDKLRQITEDHTRVMEFVKSGEISLEEAKNHKDKHSITRAMGYGSNPDFYKIRVLPDDIFLLCSDGLTNMVDDETIEKVLRDEKTMQEKAEYLVELANKNGGTDNISVVIVKIDKGDLC